MITFMWIALLFILVAVLAIAVFVLSSILKNVFRALTKAFMRD